jgi:dihydrofolate reductase
VQRRRRSKTITRAQALPEGTLHESVNDEWSFVQTLRHLVFAMDKWFTAPILAQHGGDGHIVVWGGVSLCRSLMRLDLIDELQVSLFPYVAGEGTRLFDGGPDSYQLDLVSSTASNNGIVELQYRRTYPPFRVAGLSAFMHHVFRSGH